MFRKLTEHELIELQEVLDYAIHQCMLNKDLFKLDGTEDLTPEEVNHQEEYFERIRTKMDQDILRWEKLVDRIDDHLTAETM